MDKYSNIDQGSFQVFYEDKTPTIGGKTFNSFFRSDTTRSKYEQKIKYLLQRDTLSVQLRSKFEEDTVLIFYNETLVYENYMVDTDPSISFADFCSIGFGSKEECDSIGIRINNMNLYYAPLCKDYFKVSLYYDKNTIELRFSNNLSLLF